MATTPAPLSEIGSAGHGSGWWFSLDNEHVPELRWPLSIDVYDRMRRGDAQVISALLAVKLPIERTQWRVEPNGSRPEVYGPLADDLGLPGVDGLGARSGGVGQDSSSPVAPSSALVASKPASSAASTEANHTSATVRS